MNKFTLTSSQQAAVDKFRDFLKGSDQVFMLKGAAGTGKTTIMTEFINILQDVKRPCVLMAPTGRAAYIIGNKTGHPASTIHRAIYSLKSLKSNEKDKGSEENGAMHASFALTANESPQSTVYIVDEASMISDVFSENEAFSFGSGRLLNDLFLYANGRKIVFVGDYAQLPPIGMNFSPALDKDYLKEMFNSGVTEVYLKEVLRQKGSSTMLNNAISVRDSIDKKSFVEFQLNEGDDAVSERHNLLQPYFEVSPERPNHRAVIITYSNRQALDYNISVRQHYFGLSAPRLMPGDLLLIARNNYSYDYELFNGNIVMVESCGSDKDIESRTVRIKMSKDRIETVELRFRKAVIKFNAGGKAVSLSINILDNFLDDPNGAPGGLLARALVVDFEKRLPDNIKSALPNIKRTLREHKMLSLGEKEIYENYLNLLYKDPYYNAVICKNGYAMTCHKAQGGEWPTAFVDMGRYGGTANENYFRWAYTAITRASDRIWYYSSPDFNYMGNMVVEPIQRSANLIVSTYSEDSNFLDARYRRLTQLAEKTDLMIKEDRSKDYQHRIYFVDREGKIANYILWYNKTGYTKQNPINSISEDLGNLTKEILEASLIPDDIPYANPDRPFAEKLVTFLKSQFSETGISLLNITHEQYQDIFHLKTDGLAKVSLYYTAKGNYTYMRLLSTLGENDKMLESFRQRFK